MIKLLAKLVSMVASWGPVGRPPRGGRTVTVPAWPPRQKHHPHGV